MSQGPFRAYPTKFPKARRKAADVVNQLQQLMRQGPRTLIGTIADTSFHATQGYVTAVTQLGTVSVYGIPYGTVVNGMRVLCRQMGGQSTVRSFVFDGYAPNISGAGYAGSFGYNSMVSSLSSGLAMTATSGVPTSSSYNFVYAYYWFWFFYIPQLPTSTVTLWQMISSGDSTTLSAQYLPTGQLQIIDGTGHGYISTGPVSPHNTHWIISQPGLTSLSIDNVTTNYTGIIGPGDNPSFSAGGSGYRLSLLSKSDGSQLCPLGTWIGKFGFGVAWNGVAQVALQSLGTGLGSTPIADNELPTTTSQMDIHPLYQLLCGDAQGSTTLADSAGAGGTVANITTGGSVLLQGPY